ncbi:glycosyltransferase [Rhodococcus sp. IEGM 1401]|uniref:glycosyltransferase n=1 Tax=unclassified Rhodococcus (in: high G+C Gram-positive bacteria) TaxID=192944 RepID=UPI0022B5DBE3|nr:MULTISPECIES: glycosyltransferase [unclassified Rhodococcus (in: high G+C Gram-positive bacteria)]MCZ4560897.1 glycosyltransferase [Rhodococcus sp. IEGM 1401]MDI9921038.1 glycosyltransferase [Rhodococcus sp. IEGM 1372]MDV8033362.1 glycosyltransferase [Rhodococcus sp. IEGM 1414]
MPNLVQKRRALVLAASTGGHLAQLVKLAPSLGASEDSLWITFDTEQSRSLLAGRKVLYVPYISPRDYRNIVKSFLAIRKALAADGVPYAEAISTGSGLALAALPAARASGIATRYIESVSRTEGPSISGRVLAALRFTALQTQHRRWANHRWSYAGTVMDSYRGQPTTAVTRQPRLFVTLGTIKPYRFDAMIDAILDTGLCGPTTVWQLGCTTRTDLPGQTHKVLSDEDFTRHIVDADAVITHSGVGSILKILDLGKYPIVVPRRSGRNEHVDDHQEQIAKLVSDSGIGLSLEIGEINPESIISATAVSITRVDDVSKLG